MKIPRNSPSPSYSAPALFRALWRQWIWNSKSCLRSLNQSKLKKSSLPLNYRQFGIECHCAVKRIINYVKKNISKIGIYWCGNKKLKWFFSLNHLCVFLFFQVGSFNYDAEKMVFRSEFVPDEKESIKSILDYSISINKLRDDQTHYMALGMNYSVTGFEMILQRKMSFYIVTYYLPSGTIILFFKPNRLGIF